MSGIDMKRMDYVTLAYLDSTHVNGFHLAIISEVEGQEGITLYECYPLEGGKAFELKNVWAFGPDVFTLTRKELIAFIKALRHNPILHKIRT